MQSSFDINLNLYYGALKGKMLKNDHSLLYNESQNLLSSKMLKQALQKCAIFNISFDLCTTVKVSVVV